MTPSSNPGPERQGGETAVPGWYRNRAAPGGEAWWTGREWGWPFLRPADQIGLPLPGLATAQPRWLVRHGWLLWLAVACGLALGGAAACVIAGICLATGRPVDGATSVLSPVIEPMNLVVLGAMAVSGHMRARRPAWGRDGGPPPGVGTGRRVRLRFREDRLLQVYCLIFVVFLGAFVSYLTHPGSDRWTQVSMATTVTCQFALLAAEAFGASSYARRRVSHLAGLVPARPGRA